ncbi:MAG: enoyl-CoA hydratase-related protein [Planctomycetota bacterium]
MTDLVHAETSGGVATAWLNRPPLNVLSIELLELLQRTINRLEQERPRALVLRAAGAKAFSAGVDVADHTLEKIPRMLEVFHGVLRSLWRFPSPVVSMVHAPALGGGAELCLFLDFVLASENAAFGFPEIALGCFPPVAMAGLGACVGPIRAKELVLTGRRLSAQEARGLGLVTRVVPAGEEDHGLQELLEKLLDKSPAVLRLTLDTLRAQHVGPMLHALEQIEALYLEKLMKIDDCNEGIQAFLAKRPPVWKGR